MKRPETSNSQAGISLIEVMIATIILMISSLGVIGLVWTSILMNNRNKVDSTQTMLAESILEQVNSTIIGSEKSAITDCNGKTWKISTTPPGSAVIDAHIDYTETAPPDDYHMTYVVRTPCEATGTYQTSYDVRWHIDIVGEAEGMPTNTYLVTVAAKRQGSRKSGIIDSAPINIRTMVGN